MVYGKALTQRQAEQTRNAQAPGYTCPLTGEQLPCEKCCPLNQKEQQVEAKPYVCPLTGEELPCPKCCPLNQKK
jgi:hypothetical protein